MPTPRTLAAPRCRAFVPLLRSSIPNTARRVPGGKRDGSTHGARPRERRGRVRTFVPDERDEIRPRSCESSVSCDDERSTHYGVNQVFSHISSEVFLTGFRDWVRRIEPPRRCLEARRPVPFLRRAHELRGPGNPPPGRASESFRRAPEIEDRHGPPPRHLLRDRPIVHPAALRSPSRATRTDPRTDRRARARPCADGERLTIPPRPPGAETLGAVDAESPSQ